MKNLTISLDPKLIEKARAFVEVRGISLNSYIAEILESALGGHATDQTAIQLILDLAKKSQGDSQGQEWSREDLYR